MNVEAGQVWELRIDHQDRNAFFLVYNVDSMFAHLFHLIDGWRGIEQLCAFEKPIDGCLWTRVT